MKIIRFGCGYICQGMLEIRAELITLQLLYCLLWLSTCDLNGSTPINTKISNVLMSTWVTNMGHSLKCRPRNTLMKQYSTINIYQTLILQIRSIYKIMVTAWTYLESAMKDRLEIQSRSSGSAPTYQFWGHTCTHVCFQNIWPLCGHSLCLTKANLS